ncbi:methyl-accepting chemotaxis sensory transducer with TarH sensor [Duganella sp. CF458]|uniref:methyl-accepting chemotaxis protein n=1 Tax=Duganella sp. CF458 TaxID=1884368 RepID=UPI0008E06E2B|nr:methyl-accepting chemotaxis protein [Duganella sp. CF458]SFG81722.1 methyl-accepting chemotaxis sensory transducer with TarH sensor [Duganella sp. CF458]
MFNNFKIKTLLVGVLGLLIGLLAIIGGLGILSAQRSVGLVKDVTVANQKNIAERNAIRLDMETGRSQILQALQHNPDFAWSKLHDHPLTNHFNIVDEVTARVNKRWESYLASVKTPEERKLAEDWFAKSDGLGVEHVRAATAAVKENRWDDAESVLIKKINPSYRIGDGALKTLSEHADKRIEADAAAVASGLSRNSTTVTVVLLGGLALSVFAGLVLMKAISEPLAEAMDVAHRVADGDLKGQATEHADNEFGELLRALDKMRDNLAAIVTEVRGGSDTISSASAQIAAGNMDLSDRTGEQAASLEETASSMEELTSTVRQNADNARQANQLAVSASSIATKGGEVVEQVVATMGSINESSTKIVDIIAVIDGIAFQTNILALNAAVEAARAGEQGRGFAVVASEVRNLAQRSAAAAKEIKQLIDDSVGKVESGAKLVNQAGHTMKEIVTSIQRVTDIMGEITSATQEQTAGLEQIHQAINEMDTITQQNVALVEEAASASTALQDQATGLSKIVSVFQIDGPRREHPAAVQARAVIQAVRTRPALPAKAKPAQRDGKPAASRKVANSEVGDWEEF